MPVIAVKTGTRCKICQSQRRGDIDAELELRTTLAGAPDENGVVHNFEYVKKKAEGWGVQNLTLDNIKNHWGNEKKHSYAVSSEDVRAHEEQLSQLTEEQLAVVTRLLPDWPEQTPTPEQLLELQRALFPFQLLDNIRKGKPLGITWDQVDRGINTATRRNSEEQAASLIGSLAGAIEESARTAGKAVDAALGKPEHEIIEAEVIEPKEITSGANDNE